MYQLANARKNVAHTKTRGEVKGSTRKLYRQKGTGRARVGSIRSPIRRGGGVVFGPRNTVNFTVSMNKKERRLALFHLLSWKYQSNFMKVVDTILLERIKTKDMVKVIDCLVENKDSALVVLEKKDVVLEKSSSNIPYVKVIYVDYLNPFDLLKYKMLIFLKDSFYKVNGYTL